MIVSHNYQFIFLHSLKTAGSSLTIALSRYLADDDFLSIDRYTLANFVKVDVVPTPFFSKGRVDTLKSEGFSETAEYMGNVIDAGDFSSVPETITLKKVFRDIQQSSLWDFDLRQHAHAVNVRKTFDPVWARYFKFSFERNPWNKLVSLYFWRWHQSKSKAPDFKKFVMSIDRNHEERKKHRSFAHSNWPIYAIDNTIAVDYVAQFEKLSQEAKTLQTLINTNKPASMPFELVIDMPEAKTGLKRKLDYRGQPIRFDREMDKVVRKHASNVISAFNYSCPYKVC